MVLRLGPRVRSARRTQGARSSLSQSPRGLDPVLDVVDTGLLC